MGAGISLPQSQWIAAPALAMASPARSSAAAHSADSPSAAELSGERGALTNSNARARRGNSGARGGGCAPRGAGRDRTAGRAPMGWGESSQTGRRDLEIAKRAKACAARLPLETEPVLESPERDSRTDQRVYGSAAWPTELKYCFGSRQCEGRFFCKYKTRARARVLYFRSANVPAYIFTRTVQRKSHQNLMSLLHTRLMTCARLESRDQR